MRANPHTPTKGITPVTIDFQRLQAFSTAAIEKILDLLRCVSALEHRIDGLRGIPVSTSCHFQIFQIPGVEIGDRIGRFVRELIPIPGWRVVQAPVAEQDRLGGGIDIQIIGGEAVQAEGIITLSSFSDSVTHH